MSYSARHRQPVAVTPHDPALFMTALFVNGAGPSVFFHQSQLRSHSCPIDGLVFAALCSWSLADPGRSHLV
jgi:hypothetical protein